MQADHPNLRLSACGLFNLFLLLLLAAGISGCNQDPNVLKKKYLDHGDTYYKAGKFPQASIMYRTAIRKDARYGEAYLHLARASLRMGKPATAYPALERAVELLPEGPDRVEARVALANLFLSYFRAVGFEKLQAEETDRLANDLILLDPKSYDGFRIRGTIAGLDAVELAKSHPKFSHERLLDAVSALRTADAIRPFQSDVLVSLGRSLWASGQPAEAEKYLLSAVAHHRSLVAPYSEEHFSDMATAYSELYRLYLATGRTPAAETLLQQAIAAQERSPRQHEFLQDLAGLLQSQGRRAEMAQTLEKLKAQAATFPAVYAVAGNLYLKGGDFRQAIHEYEQGITAIPKTKYFYQVLIIEALLLGNQKAEAESVNESLLRDRPKDTDALARRAGFLLEKGQTDKAVAELERLVQQAPNSALVHYQAGRGLMAQGRRETARVQFAEAIRFDPKFVPARIALAELQLMSDEFGNAVHAAEDILEIDNHNARAMLIRAVGLRRMDKGPESRKTFEFLVQQFPKYSDALYQFGVLDAQENKLKEAAELYQRSFEADPGNVRGLGAIVDAFLAKNEPDSALKIVKAEIAKYPDRPDLEVTLAATEMSTGHLDQAISDYQLLLKKLEKNPKAVGQVHFRLGTCYKRKGDYPAAIAQLEQARTLLPDYAPIFHNLGILNDMLGKKAQANKFYEASLKLNGDDPAVLNNLAYYMAENGGDLDQALTYAQRARQKTPHDLTFIDTVGVIYLKKNLVDNALDILQDLVDKKPNEAVFRLHLAEAFLKKGDTAKGRQELKTALSNKPSAEEAATIQQLLSKTGT